jgi:hypothetical protein
MLTADLRRQLAEEQARLVEALTRSGALPEGFDGDRLRAAAESLLRKRTREAAHAWPALARALGESFDEKFRDFAGRVPLPHEGGPLADGRAFAADLAARGELPDEGRLEALTVDLHYRRTARGLKRRRGLAVRVIRLRQARRLVIAVRLPWLGVRWLLG